MNAVFFIAGMCAILIVSSLWAKSIRDFLVNVSGAAIGQALASVLMQLQPQVLESQITNLRKLVEQVIQNF